MWKPIASLIIIIASVLFSTTYVIPQYERTKELRGNIATLNGISGNTETIKKLLDETAIVLEKIPKESDTRFSLLIPEEVDHLRFANMLKSMATNRGIALRDIKIEREQAGMIIGGVTKETGLLTNIKNTFSLEPGARPGGVQVGAPKLRERNYTTTKGTLSFTATYEGFKTFLSDVEKSLILVNVTELSFIPRKDVARRSPVPLYDYHMQVETYSIK